MLIDQLTPLTSWEVELVTRVSNKLGSQAVKLSIPSSGHNTHESILNWGDPEQARLTCTLAERH